MAAKQLTRVTVLKPFDYSENGWQTVSLKTNDEPLILAEMVSGLTKEGYVRPFPPAPAQVAVPLALAPHGFQTGPVTSPRSSPRGRPRLQLKSTQSAVVAASSQSTPASDSHFGQTPSTPPMTNGGQSTGEDSGSAG